MCCNREGAGVLCQRVTLLGYTHEYYVDTTILDFFVVLSYLHLQNFVACCIFWYSEAYMGLMAGGGLDSTSPC